jgi:hypothetical protein
VATEGSQGGEVPGPDAEALAPKGPTPEVDRSVAVHVTVPSGMTDGAVDRYGECVRQFALDLSRETSRLEEAARAKGIARPEITTTMVVNANEAVRHPLTDDTPMPVRILIAQSVAFATAILAPISGAYLHSWSQWALTGFFGLVAIAAQTYAIFALRRR